MKPLKGKVVVITGATGGLGEAIAQALALAGAAVVLGYHRSREVAERLAEALAPCRDGHLPVQVAVNDASSVQAMADEVRQTYGRCDILVNCAGTTRYIAHADLQALDDQLIDQILAINVRGPIACVRALQPMLAESPDGLVINISSIAARTAMGSNIAYCASKAALDNLTCSLARALAPAIRVVSVAPGLADTEFVQGLDADWRDLQAAATPLGRLAMPEEVASAVLAVASYLPFTTGAVIPVDGGRPLN